jgi:hypothetical protein
MFTKIMKWASLAALLIAVFFSSSVGYQIILQFVICLASCVVVSEALQSRKFGWGLLFIAVAILFNPVIPVLMPRSFFLVLDFLCVGLFGGSLVALKSPSRLSIASMTDCTPGGESL